MYGHQLIVLVGTAQLVDHFLCHRADISHITDAADIVTVQIDFVVHVIGDVNIAPFDQLLFTFLLSQLDAFLFATTTHLGRVQANVLVPMFMICA